MSSRSRRSLRVHDHEFLADRQAAARRLLREGSGRSDEASLAGSSLSSGHAGSFEVLPEQQQ